MKRFWKTYAATLLWSVPCLATPWLLAHFGILTEMSVLETHSFISAAVALAGSAWYLCRHVSDRKRRVLLLVLNPAMLYLLLLAVILRLLAAEPWNGWDTLVP